MDESEYFIKYNNEVLLIRIMKNRVRFLSVIGFFKPLAVPALIF